MIVSGTATMQVKSFAHLGTTAADWALERNSSQGILARMSVRHLSRSSRIRLLLGSAMSIEFVNVVVPCEEASMMGPTRVPPFTLTVRALKRTLMRDAPRCNH